MLECAIKMPGKTLARYHTAEGNGEILSAVFCPYFFKNAAVLRYGDVWIGPIAFLYQSEISSSKTGGFHHGRLFRMSHILESPWSSLSELMNMFVNSLQTVDLGWGKPQPRFFFQFISETILAPLNHFWLPGFRTLRTTKIALATAAEPLSTTLLPVATPAVVVQSTTEMSVSTQRNGETTKSPVDPVDPVVQHGFGISRLFETQI